MDAPSGSHSTVIDDDETLARKLQEEEDNLYQQHIRMNALTKADQTLALQLHDELTTKTLESDLALARQLQQAESESNPYPEGTTVNSIIDLESTTAAAAKTTTTAIPIDDKPDITDTKRKYTIDLIDDDLDRDFALAKQLEQEENDKLKFVDPSMSSSVTPSSSSVTPSSSSTPHTSVSAAMCTLTDEHDPNPDLHGLFLAFNNIYFSGRLSMVEVKWSKKMTLCAGTCRYQPAAGLCTVTLSEALLKFRPRTDMVNTLLHEMIHALLFVTQRIDNHESHGPEFLREAARINKLAGTNITVYHTFHDEVNHYKTHVWKCNGPCQYKAPYFGKVSRSMNRPPQKADRWFADHQASCGGSFVKIASPAPPPSKVKKQKKQDKEDAASKKMTDYFLND